MEGPSKYLENLIREFSKLPGIGTRSASRLAFHILKSGSSEAESLARAVLELKENIVTCSICGGISDSDVCPICADSGRDRSSVCVVENARDVLILEATGSFKGIYHVLMGTISPLDGIGPDDINIRGLVERCSAGGVAEVILALNPTIEGDATCLYIARALKPSGVRLTRIAHGLPVGADLDYVDSATIIKSIEGRVEVHS